MKIEVNVEKRHLYFFIGLIALISSVFSAAAFTLPANAVNPGHCDQYFCETTGGVGINTINPLAKLEVSSPEINGGTAVRIGSSANGGIWGTNSGGNLHIDSDNTKIDGRIYLNYFSGRGVNIGGQGGVPGVASIGGNQQQLALTGPRPDGWKGVSVGYFPSGGPAYWHQDVDGSDGTSPGSMQFWENLNGGWYDRVTFASNGNVGIRTSNPQATLDVIGNANFASNVNVGSLVVQGSDLGKNTLSSSGAILNIWTSANYANGAAPVRVGSLSITDNYGDPLPSATNLYVKGSAGVNGNVNVGGNIFVSGGEWITGTSGLTVSNGGAYFAGNVGIKKTLPQFALDVTGTVGADSVLAGSVDMYNSDGSDGYFHVIHGGCPSGEAQLNWQTVSSGITSLCFKAKS